MEIRELYSNDPEEYLSIRLEALKNNPSAFASSYEEEKNVSAEKYKNSFSNKSSAITFGAYEESQLVGVVTLVKEQPLKLSHRANLVAIYIKPEKRGYGIGKALVLSVIEQAKNIGGIEQIYLTVVTTNVQAEKMYTSCGFEVIGRDKKALKVDHTYYDEEHMVLYL